MRALALLRVLTGPIVVLHLRPFLAAADPIYNEAFYQPYLSWYPELRGGLYLALLWVGGGRGVAMSLGLFTRVATATTFAVVAYNLFLSTTHFHNNRAYLLIVLGLLALAPCGRELSLDAWIRRRRGLPALDPTAPAWPLWLLRFECAAVYGASGLSKLVDPDWFGGTVTWQRVTRARDDLDGVAGLGGVDPDRPRLPHRRGQVHRAHRAVHRARALVARQPLRRGLGGRDLPPVDRGLGGGAGLLAARDRRARGLGRALHP